MNCDEVREHWELYYDSEGDAELYLRVNDHLAACPRCSRWFSQQTQFEDALNAKLAAAASSAELWQRILSETGIVEPASTRRWAIFGSLFALAASLLAAAGVWQLTAPTEPPHLSELTAVVHRELARDSNRIQFSSQSDAEIETYLKERVPFNVRCPPRKDAGFVVRGGGVCKIAGDDAAYVVGQVEGRDVSIFILPEERLASFAHERAVLGRDAVHHCREGDYDMVLARVAHSIVVVIGQGEPDRLERVVRAYGTYPEQPASGTSGLDPPVG